MVSFEVGRVCMKIVGREAGKYCVVLKKEGKSFVWVTGPKILTGVKRRKANIEHLEPTQYIIEIPENADDEAVMNGLTKSVVFSKLGLKKPSAAEVKAEKSKVRAPIPKETPKQAEKEEKKKETKEAKDREAKEKKEKKK
jgi:large subunit ribosomal protein L14e